MNIVLYSNCQSIGIKYFLEKKLLGTYFIIENYKYFDNPENLPINILEKADVFIFQFTNSSHGICSTDINSEKNIFLYLNKNCIKIGIPSIFQSSFWPVIPGFGSCRDGHEIIKELKFKYSLEEILTLYDNKEIDFKLSERFNKCQEHTKNIENYYLTKTNLDIITITNFIKENYINYKLFITHCHPSCYIFVYIVNEIIKILNVKIENINIINYNIFDNELIIEGIPSGDWPDSLYIKKELNVNYINNINEEYFKNCIIEIYNNI